MYTKSGVGVAPQENLTITAAGNVGIGSTSPPVKFQVAGASILSNSTSIDPDSYASQTVSGAIADGSGFGLTSAIGGNAGTGDSWAMGHNGTAMFIGMQNGSAADTMQTYVQFDPNRNLYLVPVSGNVGIGTGSPATKLQVVGSATTGSIETASVFRIGRPLTSAVSFDQYKAVTKNQEMERSRSEGTKATVTYLEDFVISQEDYKTKQEEIFELNEIFGWLKAITTALEQKKDMLIQISANHRSETKMYN